MAIGRSFEESFQKALRSLETGLGGWGCDRVDQKLSSIELERLLRTPSPERIMHVRLAMKNGRSDNEIFSFSKIDPWFISKLRNIVNAEDQLVKLGNICLLYTSPSPRD